MDQPDTPLKTHHGFKDFLFFNLLSATCFFTALFAISKHSAVWMGVYLALSLLLIGTVVKTFCAHCPHYKQATKTLSCMFFWKLPKIFPHRPGVLSTREKLIAVAAFGLIFLIPLYWLILTPGLLIIYLLASASLVFAVKRDECGRCIYFDCPANKVPAHLRRLD